MKSTITMSRKNNNDTNNNNNNSYNDNNNHYDKIIAHNYTNSTSH